MIALLACVAGDATAEDGFALNRFEPAEQGSAWFALESLDFRGHGRFALGVVGDYAYQPLVLYDEADNKVQAVLSDQLYAHVGVSAVWWDRLRLSASFPVVLVSTSEAPSPGVPTVDVATGANFGDLRFGADVRVLGRYGDFISLALGTHVHAPTGSSSAFTGGKWQAQPHLLVAGQLGRFEYAASTGLDVRASASFAGQELGSEWVFAASSGVRLLSNRLLVGPELWGGTLVSSSMGVFDKEGTPVEVVLGAHYRFQELNFGLGMGPGLSRGVGSPSVRALASLQWVAEPAEPTLERPTLDLDADGIVDADDACPTEAGRASTLRARHGCPLPGDSDGDTVVDRSDACPAEPGEATSAPATNGCPPPDTDGDGLLDRDDACIERAGPTSTVAAQNGCPLPIDRDGDAIVDARDACPDQVGQPNPDAGKNGCPVVSVQGDELRVLDRIQFENGKATLTPESEPILTAVARLLEEHSEIQKLDIQGHTDGRGQHGSNLLLSERRAAAVVRWLVDHGIAAERLSSRGFGPDRPLEGNDTDLGRLRNRRVEFHVVERTTEVPARPDR